MQLVTRFVSRPSSRTDTAHRTRDTSARCPWVSSTACEWLLNASTTANFPWRFPLNQAEQHSHRDSTTRWRVCGRGEAGRFRSNQSENDRKELRLRELDECHDSRVRTIRLEANVFSLGCVFGYALLRGRHPFGIKFECVFKLKFTAS